MTKTVGNSERIDVWAATGTRTEPGGAKKDSGWLEGERPAFDFMNFIQSQFGEKINHILANGVPLWNAVDSYAADAIVARAGVIYVAVTPNTNSQPPSVNWRPLVTEATLAVAGLVRLASNAETQTGTATNRAVTPASLASRTATESRTGLVAEATQAQVNAGTGDSRFVTPAKLASRTATESRTGLVAEATQAEVNAGTGAGKFVTAVKMRLGFEVSLGANGFIKLPDWLGGIIFNWFSFNANSSNQIPNPQLIAYPRAFTSIVYYVGLSEDGAASNGIEILQADLSSPNVSNLTRIGVYSNYVGQARGFAIGR